MESKSKTWIIVLVVCLVLMLPIFIDFIGNSKVKEINYSEYLDIVNNHENALIYVGELENDSNNGKIDVLKEISKNETTTDYSSEYSIYSINSAELTDKEIATLGTKEGYVYLIAGENQSIVSANANSSELTAKVDAYYNVNFNSSNTSYKVAKDAETYEKLVNSKKVTVAVFGRDTCYYCNIYKPIYNAVAEKYGVDIYYFNSDLYDAKEYQKIMKIGLTIPAECNSSGKESLLSDGFGTPLTLITKKGKTVDCISGYVDRATLIKKLTDNKLIEK